MRIELSGVGKRFGRVTALRDVTLTIPAGGRVALVGPNGSGKSTLLRILMGMLAADGTVRVDGGAPDRDRARIARRLGYVPQVPPQLGAPVAELVGAVARLRGIDPARIAGVAERLELDLDPIARRPFRALSGGMKQKLLIALAFAPRPELLVLDEPTGSLDARARERFFGLFDDEVPPETTVLLCSHRLEEIRALVDRVLELADGRVRAYGPVSELLDGRAVSVVEVRADDRWSDWLRGRGFRRGAAGWWTRAATHGEKMTLVREVTGALNGALHDLVARDVETLDDEETETPDA